MGALPDAHIYGDTGAATLQHTLAGCGDLLLPNLQRLGCGNILGMYGLPAVDRPEASFGRAITRSAGKDTLIGHWELMGVLTEMPFRTFPQGFPSTVLEKFSAATGRGVLGNRAASGTEIIKELGDEQVESGSLIVYTSADSVFQIAAHEDVVPPRELYDACLTAAELLKREGLRVGRVIARPYVTLGDEYIRTDRRRDFLVEPPKETVLEKLLYRGVPVVSVGKIDDIFANTVFTKSRHTRDNLEGIATIIEEAKALNYGLVFANLIDFDMCYGHRRDVRGYGRALETFDRALPAIMECLADGDVLLVTADHGCDPTHTGTDHTREYVPVLLYRKGHAGRDLGTLDSLAFVGRIILDLFGDIER